MTSTDMDHNKKTLENALSKLSSYEPKDEVWTGIHQKLNEIPLQNALQNLPEYEPEELIWNTIETTSIKKPRYRFTWYAAAVILISGALGFWVSFQSTSTNVSYSEEKVDSRLTLENELVTDSQYDQLKAYCEAETVVCSSKDFKDLTNEYETLRSASEQLQQAMGNYNTEPELMRQFSLLEREKTEILNKMAKMI